jgi:hypothetical protein
LNDEQISTMSQTIERTERNIEYSIPFVKANMETDLMKMQEIFKIKHDYSGALEKIDPKQFFFVRDEENRFGFSEKMVNQLMHFAFLKGKEEGYKEGCDYGYADGEEENREYWN